MSHGDRIFRRPFILRQVAPLALLALAACHMPTDPPAGYWKTITVCALTIGDSVPTCLSERCEFVYADGSWHCPTGVYHPQQPESP